MSRSMYKEKPGKEVPGTNKVATKGDPTQMRKLRCPACQQLAVASMNSTGQFVATCSCGRSFKSSPM